MQLAYKVGKVGECLREESTNKHALRSLLCVAYEGSLKFMIEPTQAVLSLFPSLFDSAMLAGDIVSVFVP